MKKREEWEVTDSRHADSWHQHWPKWRDQEKEPGKELMGLLQFVLSQTRGNWVQVSNHALEIQAGNSLEGLLSVNSDIVSQVWATGFSIWSLEELVGVIISVGNLPWTVQGVMSHNKLCSVDSVTETTRTSNVSRSHTKTPHWTLEGKIWLLCSLKK